MTKFIVFDNGGKTIDRYTIINKETGDVYGISENPYDTKGIAKFCGNCADHRIVLRGAGWRQKLPLKKVIQAEVENYVNNARLDPGWIGDEVNVKNLPENVRKYIADIDTPDKLTQVAKSNNNNAQKEPKHQPVSNIVAHH